MQERSKIAQFIWNTIGGLIIAMSFTNSIFASNTATFSASCSMPEYVTMEEIAPANTPAPQAEQINVEQFKIEESVQFIQQQEIISLDNASMEIINTVCAK
jgi:hypothetical protein